MPAKKTHSQYLLDLKNKNIHFVPLEPYLGSRIAIKHSCGSHEWLAMPMNILAGTNCPYCSGKKTPEQYRKELIDKCLPYIALEDYIQANTKILHRCIEGHEWKVTPSHILSGKNCPSCSRSGFDPNKPGIIYYIKIGKYYKIGVTNLDIKTRFIKDKDKEITVINQKYFEKGSDALDLEQLIIKLYKPIKVDNYLKSGGNTELFEEYLEKINETIGHSGTSGSSSVQPATSSRSSSDSVSGTASSTNGSR